MAKFTVTYDVTVEGYEGETEIRRACAEAEHVLSICNLWYNRNLDEEGNLPDMSNEECRKILTGLVRAQVHEISQAASGVTMMQQYQGIAKDLVLRGGTQRSLGLREMVSRNPALAVEQVEVNKIRLHYPYLDAEIYLGGVIPPNCDLHSAKIYLESHRLRADVMFKNGDFSVPTAEQPTAEPVSTPTEPAATPSEHQPARRENVGDLWDELERVQSQLHAIMVRLDALEGSETQV